MSALQQLLGLVHADDPIAAAPDNLLAVQLAAVQQRLDQRRRQIRVLDQRATDRGIDTISSLEDAVSLLFSDATYKSYPESFLDQRRWDRLTAWFQTLASDRLDGVDLKGVDTLDDWLLALQRIGIWVNSSSGTSGKSSFLAMNRADLDVALPLMVQAGRYTSAAVREAPPHSFAVFVLGPSSASYSGSLRARMYAEALARPGEIHYISDVGQSAQEGLDLARLNRAIAAGTAKPSEIQMVQERARERAERISQDFDRFLDRLIARLDEPVALLGLSSMLFQVMERAKARGITRMPLHPDSFASISGGRKGTKLPDDYMQQLRDYFGLTDRVHASPYGMTEMSGACPMLPGQQSWAIPPWIVPLVLEATDETLLSPAGTTGRVTGRFAFIDLLVEGRWGGLVTGDQVTIDFSPPGLRTPVIRAVDRYKDLPGDDKATCAGTIDAYVRGALEPA